jgi:murein DD-endopeptidase MepM/ murein hydrolase activator NlpD
MLGLPCTIHKRRVRDVGIRKTVSEVVLRRADHSMKDNKTFIKRHTQYGGEKYSFSPTVILVAIMVIALPLLTVVPVSASSNTFTWPIGSSDTGGYRWFGYIASDWNYQYHLGQDFKASVGTPVYAIADGYVIDARMDVSKYGGYNKPGGGIKIRHKTSSGREFTALYAHVNNIRVPLYSCGTRVRQGQIIAYVAPYISDSQGNSIPHLHFGINLANPYSVGWEGYGYSLGSWTDPMVFLRVNSPYPNPYW